MEENEFPDSPPSEPDSAERARQRILALLRILAKEVAQTLMRQTPERPTDVGSAGLESGQETPRGIGSTKFQLPSDDNNASRS